MEVWAAAGVGLLVFVGVALLLDQGNRAQRAIDKILTEIEAQEQARIKRHDDTLEALKTRRRAP